MLPFPPVTKLREAFRGDAISQIWLDPFGVRFLFESSKSLYAETAIEHVESDGTFWSFKCEAADGPPLVLHRLLGKKILEVEREDLRLTFNVEDGASLSILSELGPRESGHINTPEGDFVVF